MLDQPAPEVLLARIDEIDRAITTRPPSALDTALLLVERKSAYEVLYPAAGHGGDRKSKDFRDGIKPQAISFCSATAEKLGLSERSIQLMVQMGEAVTPFATFLRATPIVDNSAALRSFVALDEAARSSVVGIWTGNPKLSFKNVLVAARLQAERDADEALFRSLVANWARAGSRARRRFLEEIGLEAKAADALVRKAQKRGTK